MLPSLIEFLEHIQQQAAYIVRRSKDLDYDTFLNHDDLPRAFERSLEIIGEATKQLPSDFTTQYLTFNGVCANAQSFDQCPQYLNLF